MKFGNMYSRFCALTAAVCISATLHGVAAAAIRADLDTTHIEQLTGARGAWNTTEGVFKISVPRTDVKVNVDGTVLPPFMGLTSWAAFKAGGKEGTMVMGDLVLFEDEVNPVMTLLLDSGLNVTALHNHFFFDQPRVYFMHLAGEGATDMLANGVRVALNKVKELRASSPELTQRFVSDSPAIATSSSITGARLDTLLGVKGQSKDGMYKAVIGRTVKMPCGCEVGKEMGVNTWAAFMGDDENAIVDGDFVTLPGELQSVLRALRKSGINIVAIHNHMEGDDPKAIFLHYWGRGPASRLALGVKAALDAQAAIKH